MRIAHITATFPPYEAGTGRVCYYNALELARLGHEVTVYTAKHPPGEPIYPQEITVRRLPVTFHVGNAPLLPGLLGLRDYDILHLHFPFIFGAELIRVVSLLRGIPYVITHHNDLSGEGLRELLFRLYFPLTKAFVAANASKYVVVALNHAQHCNLTSLYEQRWQDVCEVANAVDTDYFHPNYDRRPICEQTGIAPDAPLILFVGVLDHAHSFKRLDRLLKAVAQLQRDDMHLLVIGDGELRSNYEMLATSLGIAENVVFAGKIHHHELGAYYAAADFVVLPSTPPESFGMVLIEAAACGKAVIASDIPGVRSVVDDGVTGLLASPDDLSDLAHKIECLLNDPIKCREYGANGLIKARTHYTWQLAAQKLEALYRDVLESRSQ